MTRSICCVLFVVAAICTPRAQQSTEAPPKPDQFAGTWSGGWEGGGGSGGFELILEQPKEGPLTGKVAVTGEPAYKAVFKSLSFDGKKMTAKYDFPLDDQVEVILTATFDGGKATGGWSAIAKAGNAEVASGSWTVSKTPAK